MTVVARCAIIIPTYGRSELLRRCLTALLRSLAGGRDVDVVVVDDGSPDDTPDVLASFSDRVMAVGTGQNAGFAAACNLGASVTDAETLVFYNNDLVPTNGWLDNLLAYQESHPTAGVVGTKLLFTDGTVQHAGVAICADGFPRHIYAGFPSEHPVVNRSGSVRIVTGACMLIRRGWFSRLGGFDTSFRNGYEDVDLCLRTGALGGEVHYCHTSQLVHLVSMTRHSRRQEFAESERIYRERWGHLVPDDFARYVADGLVRVDFGPRFPFRLTVAPELASIVGFTPERMAAEVDHLSRLLHDAHRELSRLRPFLDLRAADAVGSSLADDGTPHDERVHPGGEE